MSRNGTIRFLSIQVRLGVITIEEVPEEYRDQVKQKLGM